MFGKSLIRCLLLVSFLLIASCSPGSNPDSTEWPDNNDIATMIALTLTQRVQDGSQATPQPGTREEKSEEVGEDPDIVGINIDDIPGEQPSVDNTSNGQGDLTPVDGGDDQQATEESSGQPIEEAGIPGLHAFDLVARLVEFGFDCPETDNQPGTAYARQCVFETADYQFVVTIWGRSIQEIDLVEAVAFYFGDLDYRALTSVVFEMVAGLPYDGAVPEIAQEWVMGRLDDVQMIGDEAISEFGGVRYYMYALPSAQVLEMGQVVEE